MSLEGGRGGDAVPPKGGRGGDEVPMAVCASHIACATRCRLLRGMIASVVAQTVPTRFVASVSFERDQAAAVLALKRDFQNDVDVEIVLQPRRLSQFQHLDYICRHALARDAWCMFCDDDDFCHPDRCRQYARALRSADETDLWVWCGPTLKVHGSIAFQSVGACERALAASCRARPAASCAWIKVFWTFCVRASALRRFCAAVDDAVLEDPTCDVLFRALMIDTCRVHVSAPHWLYAYGYALGAASARHLNARATFQGAFLDAAVDALAAEFDDLRWEPETMTFVRKHVALCVQDELVERRPASSFIGKLITLLHAPFSGARV